MATNFLINGSEFSDNFIPKDAFTTGGLWGWGDNYMMQFGDGTQYTRFNSPVLLSGYYNNWKQLPFGGETIQLGAIKTDGTLWKWGVASYGGNAGNNTSIDNSVPVQVAGTWKQISGYVNRSAGIKTDGTLWNWGAHNLGFDYGRLGDNSTVSSRSSPVQTAVGGTNWKMVSVGQYHTAAIKTDGTLWLWGGGNNGQLGHNSTSTASTPVQTIAGGTNWRQVSCYGRITMATKTDGTLWTWGSGYVGGLGNGSTSDRSSPVQVGTGTDWKLVSCGNYNGSAIKTDGTLWVWGNNSDYGQLGDGTNTNRSSPVQTIAGGNNWKSVCNGGYLNAAIKTDGTLWVWGYNGTNSLGDGTTTHRSSPVQTLVGGNNWKSVMCSSWAGYGFMLALRDNS